MADALRALIDAAELEVHHGHEVLSDADQWTLDLGPSDGAVWVASSCDTDVWVRDGTHIDRVRRGTAALLVPSGTLTVSTSIDRSPPPTSDGGLFGPTGIHVGTASFGPLASEAFPLPRVAQTQPVNLPDDDVIRALGHLELLSGGRWRDAHRDQLATVVVTAVMRSCPPSFLSDNSIARCIDRLVAAERPVPIDDLVRGTGRSASTVRRRFRDATGRSPDELRRWFRSLPVRAALAGGTEPAVVADQFGYSTVSSMRRALARVTPPVTQVPFEL